MFDRAQLRKGTLEGCILKIIAREAAYGYAIAATLRENGFTDLTEGTLYPLLLRLERKGLIRAEYRAGQGGPSRKYYTLTKAGSICRNLWRPGGRRPPASTRFCKIETFLPGFPCHWKGW